MDLSNKGIVPSHRTVKMLMRRERPLGASPKAGKRYNSCRGEVGKVAPYLPSKEFFPGRPMERFATDVSLFAIGAGKLYLPPITGMGTNEIVAYDVSRTANLQQMSRRPGKLGRALRKNNASGALLHPARAGSTKTFIARAGPSPIMWLKACRERRRPMTK